MRSQPSEASRMGPGWACQAAFRKVWEEAPNRKHFVLSRKLDLTSNETSFPESETGTRRNSKLASPSSGAEPE